MLNDYTLIDSGTGRKLERFGQYVIVRPCSQALWRPRLDESVWNDADAVFTRDPGNCWRRREGLPDRWQIQLNGLRFLLSPTDFGHLGVFPEHSNHWSWLRQCIQGRSNASFLNLFAYSGGATCVLASNGALVTHLDASKGMISWARENTTLNGLGDAPIRWILDDAMKFMKRERRRGIRYDGIVLDPPSFGRGNKGQVFKLERDLFILLELCRQCLSPEPRFFLVTTHSPGISPQVLKNMLVSLCGNYPGMIEAAEMIIPTENSSPLPCGSFARWSSDA